jgi:hypothetical protein
MNLAQIEGGAFGLDTTVMTHFMMRCEDLWPICW